MSYLWYWPSGGWDFDAWKARHPWQPMHSNQSGRMDLLPLLGPPASLPTAKEGKREWSKKRKTLLQMTHELLGKITDKRPRKPRLQILEERKGDPFQMWRLRYSLTDEEWGYAWLLIPKGKAKKRPAVIALHQTVLQGKDEPVGIEGNPDLAYGKHLAERGFVVLAPDAVGFGERGKDHPNTLYRSADQFFRRHPEGSVMGKMAFDTSRAVDLLQRLPEVDGQRIGCIGHSHGGYGTLFAMIYDERIRSGVISCGVTILRSDPTPQRWWRLTALIPRLGYYENQIEQTPLDFHHLLALVAPRSLLVSAALKDGIFPNTDNLKQVSTLVRGVYRAYGAPQAFQRWIFQGDHRFPPQARNRAYALFEETLRLHR